MLADTASIFLDARMASIDPVAWGWGFLGLGATIIGVVASIAIRKLPVVVSGIGFLIGLASVGFGLWLLVPVWLDRSPPAQLSSSKPTPNNAGVHPTQPQPIQRPEAITRSKMAWGTLPPNGTPAIAYAIVNVGPGGIKDVYASVWLRQANGLMKLDERQMGYIAPGEFRQSESHVASTPYGQGLLCLSFEHNGRRMSVVNFFESVGGYAKYGPLRDMQTARDPITILQNAEFCRSGVQRAAFDWR
jgi:hypothetical protein